MRRRTPARPAGLLHQLYALEQTRFLDIAFGQHGERAVRVAQDLQLPLVAVPQDDPGDLGCAGERALHGGDELFAVRRVYLAALNQAGDIGDDLTDRLDMAADLVLDRLNGEGRGVAQKLDGVVVGRLAGEQEHKPGGQKYKR